MKCIQLRVQTVTNISDTEHNVVFLSDTTEITSKDERWDILYNFELSVAVRKVGGEDSSRGDPEAARFQISDRGAESRVAGERRTVGGPIVKF